MKLLVSISIIVIGLFFPIVICHPQCLDFRPPFESSEQLFCSEYREFGCCSLNHSETIRVKFEKIQKEVENDAGIDRKECMVFLKNILCQECSPYAAHAYNAEDTKVQRPFPGLCMNYCKEFYGKCRRLIPYISKDQSISQRSETVDQFCNYIQLPDKDYCFPEWINVLSLNRSITRDARNEEGCLCLEPFAPNSTIRNALSFVFPPDGTDRIFVSEQIGYVHIFYRNQTMLPEPFMNLQDVVISSRNAGDERGFLDLAFHPDYKNNGRLFIYYNVRVNNGDFTRISEFRVSNDPNKVNRSSERVVLDISQPYSNHNGGELLFDALGYLVAFIGDGGAGGDPHGHGQNKSTLLGSVLRLDVDHYNMTHPYSIPPDNPFINETGSRPEIYAYGIRNIWRCDVDEGDPDTGYGRGRIFCGDVGQSLYEEIDIIEKGGNYGWNAREGFQCYRRETCGKIGPEVLPIHVYNHTVGKSVTGGHVYRGCLNPNLQGQYIYGDYDNGKLFSLKEETNGSTVQWKNRELLMCGQDVCFNGLISRYQRNILSFGEDQDGEIYMLSTDYASSTHFGSKIYKLVDPRRRGDPTKCRTYDGLKEVPIAPPSPSIVSVRMNLRNVTLIDVTWRDDLSYRGKITYYRIQYRTVKTGASLGPDDGWQYVDSRVPADRQALSVPELTPANSYQFRVFTVNDFGSSPPSQPSQVLDFSMKVPGGPPTGIVAYGYTASSIVVWWNSPNETLWNGALTGFDVRYKAVSAPNDTMQHKVISYAHITAEIINNLAVYTEYDISVAAMNQAGLSEYSLPVKARTYEGVPTAPPRDVQCQAESSTQLRISWLPPDVSTIHGRSLGYKIRARESAYRWREAQLTVSVQSETDRHVAVLSGLEKYTEYEVLVSCFTSAGSGPDSSPVQLRTLEDVPEKVDNLMFLNMRPTSVDVSWDEPWRTYGTLTGYTLSYTRVDVPSSRVEVPLSPNVTEYTMSNLTADVNYTVTLYASTSAGAGPARTHTINTYTTTPGHIEICHLELPYGARTLQCGAGEVINKTSVSALYGRRSVGRCIRDGSGVIGCGDDVTAEIVDRCAGRKQCMLDDWFLQNRIIIGDKSTNTCPLGLESYLDIRYSCMKDPCSVKPCQNDGSCTASEDPYKLGYYCYCRRKYGGKHCQIADPCNLHPCPPDVTVLCISVMADDVKGRVCYDKRYKIID